MKKQESEMLKDFHAFKKYEISPDGISGGKQSGWTQVSNSTTKTYNGGVYAGTDEDPDGREDDA